MKGISSRCRATDPFKKPKESVPHLGLLSVGAGVLVAPRVLSLRFGELEGAEHGVLSLLKLKRYKVTGAIEELVVRRSQ